MRPNRIIRLFIPILLTLAGVAGLLHALTAGAPARAAAPTAVSTTILTNTTWSLAGSPYRITSTLTITPGAVLTIAPGVRVETDGSGFTALRVRAGAGLVARGTPTRPITFTAAPGSAWDGLRVQGTAVFDHVHLLDSAKDGLTVDGGSVAVTCSSVANHAGRGIAVTPNGLPSLLVRHSNLAGSAIAGLAAYHIGIDDIPASLNWWGDRSGPSGDGPGSGDAVIGRITFAPWLREPAVCPVPDYTYYLFLPAVTAAD